MWQANAGESAEKWKDKKEARPRVKRQIGELPGVGSAVEADDDAFPTPRD